MQRLNEIIYVVNSLLTLQFAGAASPTVYTFGKSCSIHPQEFNEDSSFYVAYYGGNGSSDMWCSHIAFSGHVSNSKDKYQICATPKIYEDPSCRMILTLRNSLNGPVLKTFACHSISMSKFCAKQGEDLYMVAQFFPASKWKREFLFYVDVTKTYSYVEMLVGIIGGVTGCGILIFICVFFLSRKKKISNLFLRHPIVCCKQTHSMEDDNELSVSSEQTDSGTSNITPSLINDLFDVPLTSRENGVTAIRAAPPPYEAHSDASYNPPTYSSLYM